MDWDQPKYRLRDAAKVSGWPLNTLRDYFARDVFSWQEGDASADVAGSSALLSLRSVMRLAIARHLWMCCQRPKDAFLAAIQFTDVGSRSHDPASRLPGELFDHAFETLLVFRPQQGAHVIAVERSKRLDIDEITTDIFGSPGAVIVLDVGAVFHGILKHLEITTGSRE
ncbi:hypothetical protein [Sphingobium chlorophenolicum]|uniref:hypothetical protein n=1 Tax=Sphingobium chlorophenolicum TaxID=46429 RepID=UPI0012DFE2F5|nr:hypothetical protein [Sphingobium chlorophenolicum]